jgi:hypothetical protein
MRGPPSAPQFLNGALGQLANPKGMNDAGGACHRCERLAPVLALLRMGYSELALEQRNKAAQILWIVWIRIN